MKNIIVPIDFSICAENGLKYACKLAKVLYANVYVVYINRVDMITTGDVVVPTYPSTMLVEQKLKKIEQELVSQNIKATCMIAEGFLNDKLVELAEEKKATLIVMGTRGAYEPLSTWFGNNTSSLIDRKKIPVLAIPENYRGDLEKGGSIVLATDFKDINDWNILKLIKAIAHKTSSTIKVFHVANTHEDAEIKHFNKKQYEDLEAFFEGVKVELHQSKKDDIVAATEDFASKSDASMVVMIAHDRSWLENLFHKSMTNKMALHAKIPFVSIPDVHAELNQVAQTGYW